MDSKVVQPGTTIQGSVVPVQECVSEFTHCLNTMSHSRAGWDYYDMPREQRDRENRQEREALARARAIWTGNPTLHDELRAAFTAASPLATMSEIERTP